MLRKPVMLFLVFGLFCFGSANAQIWIPVVAHTSGLEESEWRSDVSVLNLCAETAVVELVLHSALGTSSAEYEIGPGRQQLFEDVVSQLAAGDRLGSLEIISEYPVTVTSRTFNLSTGGTYGQGFDGLASGDGIESGQSVVLQQLRQDDSFRSNIGVLNMGDEMLTVEITLFDRLGDEVGAYLVEVEEGTTVQETTPFLTFGRSDIVAGYAKVSVISGSLAWPYASVVDDRSGDPRTVTPMVIGQCPIDIKDRLAAIDGMMVVEKLTFVDGYRYFWLYYPQAIDHDDPDQTFLQFMTLLHRSESAPMVYETLGYSNGVEDDLGELSLLLGANQLSVEHRFYGRSDPGIEYIDHLNIEQAAADHHEIAEIMQAIYSGPWVNSGGSKGGMTAVFHRRFYPDDVDATVPFVAPISFAAPDERYPPFIDSRGESECRDALVAVQRKLLIRREFMLELISQFAHNYNLSFDRIGGQEIAFESSVVELPFTFWQYSGETYCSTIPRDTMGDDGLFEFFIDVVPIWWAADSMLDFFDSYYYQAQQQLGYPALSSAAIDDLLETEWVSLERGLVPIGVSEPVYDPQSMLDIQDWVTNEGERLLFIYGENDPWTAGAFDLGNSVDSALFIAPGGTHGAGIEDLVPDDKAAVITMLERWMGVEIDLDRAATARPMSDRRGRMIDLLDDL